MATNLGVENGDGRPDLLKEDVAGRGQDEHAPDHRWQPHGTLPACMLLLQCPRGAERVWRVRAGKGGKKKKKERERKRTRTHDFGRSANNEKERKKEEKNETKKNGTVANE